MLPEAGQINII